MTDSHQPKPFVKWAGGKGHLLDQLQLLLPNNFEAIEDVTYVEPFVGGGAMLFFILKQYKNIKRVIINDINTDLITCYRLIKEDPAPLITELRKIEDKYLKLHVEKQKELYYSIRNEYNLRRSSPLKLATFFIFLNHTCFNGLYRVNFKSQFNVPYGKYNHPRICDEETLLADHKLFKDLDIIILNGDYKCVNDHISSQEHSFVYLDPPYMPISVTSYFKQYSSSPFDEGEQERLEEFCSELDKRGCKIMLSNSDCKKEDGKSYFESLYSNFKIERIFARRYINAHTNKRDKLSEIVIRNY